MNAQLSKIEARKRRENRRFRGAPPLRMQHAQFSPVGHVWSPAQERQTRYPPSPRERGIQGGVEGSPVVASARGKTRDERSSESYSAQPGAGSSPPMPA